MNYILLSYGLPALGGVLGTMFIVWSANRASRIENARPVYVSELI